MEENMQNQPQEAQTPPSKEKNTGMAIVAYILFFIPLLTDAKKDPFVKYHVKQGLVVFIGWMILWLIGYILFYIPFVGWMLYQLLYLVMIVLVIIGIINAAQGKQKPLPVVGQFGEKFKF